MTTEKDTEEEVLDTLLYREWINYTVLLHSTGNSTQYPVINHNGKEYEKRMCVSIDIVIDIYIYELNHFAIQQKLTHHCQAITLQ